MIISHKYKFIFIKTRKTAGTSIEVDLNPFLGERDIATPIYPSVDGHIPKNYKRGFFQKDFKNHMSAREVKQFVGKNIFSDYFVFCVEREPVDKCISHYSMLKNSSNHNKNTKEMSFDEYVALKRFPNDVDKYTSENEELLVDKIVKYENLATDLSEIAKMLGFDLKLSSRAKVGFREDIQVSDLHKEVIYEAFSNSLRFTEYQY